MSLHYKLSIDLKLNPTQRIKLLFFLPAFVSFLLLFALLSGCSSLSSSPPSSDPCKELAQDTILKKDTLIVIDTSLLDPCPSLPKLKQTEYTQQQALLVLKDWIYKYKMCAKKHALLAEWAREASGMNSTFANKESFNAIDQVVNSYYPRTKPNSKGKEK